MAIVYDQPELQKGAEVEQTQTVYPSRPNGSLYSRQKRSIADACEWLRLNQTRDRKALIFCLTSPGFVSIANTPGFISKFFENMKANYGLGEYVWVREHTKRGFPHFHCVAHWHPYKYFLDERRDAPGLDSYRMISEISRYWSSLFGSDSINSIRLGSYYKKKRVSFYLSNEKHAWYLTKYLGKSIGDDMNSYLAEAGFPQTKYKKANRSFGMSELVSELSEPDLFEADYVLESSQDVVKPLDNSIYRLERFKRVWKASEIDVTKRKGVNEILQPNQVMSAYDWKWTGHGQTFIGMDLKRTAKGRRKPAATAPTSERGQ